MSKTSISFGLVKDSLQIAQLQNQISMNQQQIQELYMEMDDLKEQRVCLDCSALILRISISESL